MIRAFAATIYAAAALAMAEVLDIQPVTDEPSVIGDTLEGDTRLCSATPCRAAASTGPPQMSRIAVSASCLKRLPLQR